MKLVAHPVFDHCHIVHQITNNLHQKKDEWPTWFRKKTGNEWPTRYTATKIAKKLHVMKSFQTNMSTRKSELLVSSLFHREGAPAQ